MSVARDAWTKLRGLKDSLSGASSEACRPACLACELWFETDGVWRADDRQVALECLVPWVMPSASLIGDGAVVATVPPTTAGLALALWAGAGDRLPAAWESAPEDTRRAAVRRAVSGPWPDVDALEGVLLRMPDALRDELVATWAKRRRFSHTAAEYTAIAMMNEPVRRLEAMADVAFRTAMNPTVARSWALDGLEIAKSLPAEPTSMGKTFSEVAILCAAAGVMDDAERMLEAAATNLARVTAAVALAPIYRAGLFAAAMLGIKRWQALLEHAYENRGLLRDTGAFLDVRVAAVMALPRAARSSDEVDRAHGVLKDVARRLPDRGLSLLLSATVIELLAGFGARSLDVPFAALRDGLRSGPLPRARDLGRLDVAGRVDLEHVVWPVVRARPNEAVDLADACPRFEDRVAWLVAGMPLWISEAA